MERAKIGSCELLNGKGYFLGIFLCYFQFSSVVKSSHSGGRSLFTSSMNGFFSSAK